ncbi:type VI secretion system baseplate subunit TssG [Vibrio harveyi]|nr:type VI secretion system baseplate subunit TssG [Vibrio harveyi]
MMSMSLINDLKANPHEYDFAQAMRLLMQMTKLSGHKLKLELKAEAMPHGDADDIQYFSFSDHSAKVRIAQQALSGAQGVIPNYIYEELLFALHNDDHALKDFLDVFNQRHFELAAQLELAPHLLVQKELAKEKTDLLKQLANLKREHGALFQYSLLFAQGHRNLETLEQILNDYFPYQIDVSTKSHERRQLPASSLTRLGQRDDYNSGIGQGFLIGKTCMTYNQHLVVSIQPANRKELHQIHRDTQLASHMRQLIQHYLRDATPISIYLNVKRAYLEKPRLSAQPDQAAKLGEVDCLAPERKPTERIRILLK